jgi:hypothetical protein
MPRDGDNNLRCGVTAELLTGSSKSTMAKDETVDQYLKRITHLTLNNKNLHRMENLETCSKLRVLLYNYIADPLSQGRLGIVSLR